jgi:hypothetical protein
MEKEQRYVSISLHAIGASFSIWKQTKKMDVVEAGRRGRQ